MFSTVKLTAAVMTAVTLSACAPDLGDFTGTMPALGLADGSVQQTAVAMVYDKQCLGPTVIQMITYHAPRGSNNLKPVASGTVSGDGQCVALIGAAGRIIGYAVMKGVTNNVSSVAVSSSRAVATAVSG